MTEATAGSPESIILIGDIGGTNARFALSHCDAPGFTHEQTFACADFPSAEEAIGAYLQAVERAVPQVICLAVAGPVFDQAIEFTNNDWKLSSASLEQTFTGSAAHLLNDFEAVAWSIPSLRDEERFAVGVPGRSDLSRNRYTLGVLGPGTGLGVAGLRYESGTLTVLAGEGGHVGFAPENTAQLEMLRRLQSSHDRISSERLLSGDGLRNIYQALAAAEVGNEAPDAAGIFAAAIDGSDAVAVRTVGMFFRILGQVAGDLTLTLGAFDGIYIAGGVVPRYTDLMAASEFREAFENKGRLRSSLERVPTQVILHEQPGLLGASHFAVEILKNQR